MPPHTLCTSRNERENLRAVTPRGVARGRETRRRRESVGTDSRVLRLETPVGAPVEASGAKFFSGGESLNVGVNARAKT
jgi:hypothetical protein